eukprot:gene7695-biopygen3073
MIACFRKPYSWVEELPLERILPPLGRSGLQNCGTSWQLALVYQQLAAPSLQLAAGGLQLAACILQLELTHAVDNWASGRTCFKNGLSGGGEAGRLVVRRVQRVQLGQATKYTCKQSHPG